MKYANNAKNNRTIKGLFRVWLGDQVLCGQLLHRRPSLVGVSCGVGDLLRFSWTLVNISSVCRGNKTAAKGEREVGTAWASQKAGPRHAGQ